MLAYTYEENGKFVLKEKEKPTLQSEDDAIVRVTLASICSSDLHIKHGAVPRAVPGITVGHEMVGIVEETGRRVTKVKPGDRVTVNVETFCGECFFCKNGFVNNCTDQNGGWALGCGSSIGLCWGNAGVAFGACALGVEALFRRTAGGGALTSAKMAL